MLRRFRKRLGLHPRAWLHSAFTYSRFMGRIKPQLLEGTEAEIHARLAALKRSWEPRELKVPVGKRIVVVAPHPDDETIGAGGLLLAHRRQADVSIVTVFNGEGGGQLGTSPWENEPSYKTKLVQARKRELDQASTGLQARVVHAMDLPDGYSHPTPQDAQRLRSLVEALQPDVILIPWFLDGLPDHQMANLLYAAGCGDLDCMVLGMEIWTLCQPNAFFVTTAWHEEKLALVRYYKTQLETVDYERLVTGLGLTRGFQMGSGVRRTSAAEAFFALPNRDYCDIVRSYYGTPGALTETARRIFQQKQP
jgi:LmbE family N-acetylglucosaminyl deacetylase